MTTAIKNNYLGTAIAIAANVHKNQTDKGGKAYILHPMRIMMRLRTNDEELMSIAILHDVIEDSNGEYTIEKLREIGFSERVLAALSLLTHNPKEDYQEYIKKIAMNPDAILVKLEDLRDNSDITRMKGLREKDFERIKKYNKAFQYLQNVMDAMRKSGYL